MRTGEVAPESLQWYLEMMGFITTICTVQLPPTVTREIKILKLLDHPNIVRLLDVLTSKHSQFEGKNAILNPHANDSALIGLGCEA